MSIVRKSFKLQHLLVQTPERRVENKVTGHVKMVAGDMVFYDELPHGNGITKANVVSLTKKQLLYLCRIHQISVVIPDKAISLLAKEIGNNRSRAIVSSELKQRGDEYVVDGVSKKYEVTWYDNKIDSLELPKTFTDIIDQRIIDEIFGDWEVVTSVEPEAPAEPAL